MTPSGIEPAISGLVAQCLLTCWRIAACHTRESDAFRSEECRYCYKLGSNYTLSRQTDNIQYLLL